MWKTLQPWVICLTCMAIFSVPSARSQQTRQVGPAPVPTALLTARKVFISNAGADSGLFPHPFSGDPNRSYNQFYAAIQGTGRYEVVAEPLEADLVLEIQLIAPYGPTNANKQKGAPEPLPMFRLRIFDGKTHYILWTLTESIAPAYLQKTHDRNFDESLAALTQDLKGLTSNSPNSAP